MLKDRLRAYRDLAATESRDAETWQEMVFWEDHERILAECVRHGPGRPRDFCRWARKQKRRHFYTSCAWDDVIAIARNRMVVNRRGTIAPRWRQYRG